MDERVLGLIQADLYQMFNDACEAERRYQHESNRKYRELRRELAANRKAAKEEKERQKAGSHNADADVAVNK